MSRKIVAGNWKMNNTWPEALKLLGELNDLSENWPEDVKVIVAPPAPFLRGLLDIARDRIVVAAQNCSHETSGAFTGEWSAEMLNSIGVNHCIVGHSERRSMFGDSNEIVGQKVKVCLSMGVRPIFCCGEELEAREKGEQNEVVKAQLKAATSDLSANQLSRIIIAYEPVWAIGTGKTASAEQAQEMHHFIRECLREDFGVLADMVPILYGGSCKPGNAAEIFDGEDVDGGLIGGASLKSSDFNDIILANG
jgi:triosephosphate isomerase